MRIRSVREVSGGTYTATCAGCGQQDGPFLDHHHADFVLERLGWRLVPPVEAWVDNTWQPGHKRSWFCAHCLPSWDRARRWRQRRTAS